MKTKHSINQEITHHSTVLMTYNHEDFLAQCIESVLNQETNYNFEIIIIDDLSTDKTALIARRYEQKYPEIIKFYQTTQNQGKGRLAVFNVRPIIRGKYWSNLEGDDFLINSKKLETQISFLEENPNYVGCTSSFIFLDERNNKKEVYTPDLSEWEITDMVTGTHSLYSHNSTWVWRNIFSAQNNDDFHLAEEMKEADSFGDTALQHFIAWRGKKLGIPQIKCFQEPMSCYRYSGKGIWSSLSEKQQEKKNIEILESINRITDYKYSDLIKKRRNRSRIANFLKKVSPEIYRTIKKIFIKTSQLLEKFLK